MDIVIDWTATHYIWLASAPSYPGWQCFKRPTEPFPRTCGSLGPGSQAKLFRVISYFYVREQNIGRTCVVRESFDDSLLASRTLGTLF